MQASVGIVESLAIVLLAGLAVAYGVGWRRLHRVMPTLATPLRLVAFAIALSALTLALVWPLPGWSNYLLAMRSLQKALVCMIAGPFFWLASPVHVIGWGMRGQAGRAAFSLVHRTWAKRLLRSISQPMVAWFAYVAAFLLWHDPSISQFLVGDSWVHSAAPWLLLGAALLFWWPVVDAGPRFHRGLPSWLLIVYLLTVEVANMAAGMTIAFAKEPLYPYYPALRAQLAPDALPLSYFSDQMIGGAVIWIFGSVVYVFSIISVLHRLFRLDGSTTPQPLPNWDENEKFIAPGLEHRVAQNQLRKADLSHH
jgi:cytochrome c oxidase assembly factor CtaG